MVAPELAFAENVRDLLQGFGTARLEYITAEFQPFSNQQRPDVVFIPNVGGFRGQLIFIEIKLSTKPIRDGQGFQVVIEHKEFAGEALETTIARYIYVTSGDVSEFSKKHLTENGILVFDRVSTQEEVVERLRDLGILPQQ